MAWTQNHSSQAGPTVDSNEDRTTKGERREQKRRKKHEMKVSGSSVRQLQDIIRKKAEDAKRGDT